MYCKLDHFGHVSWFYMVSLIWAESELMISGSHMALQNICMRIGDQPARHGDWEPFLERFDFGFTLNVTKTKSLTMQLGTTVG